jgi:endonuclease/exonuclease/phosphatase family metal-dependent hydrolase
MASQFSPNDWANVRAKLSGHEAAYGMPEQRPGSVILASWNIRKFGALNGSDGKPSNSEGAYAFIADFCSRCDIVSVQEVLDSVESIERLRDDLNARVPSKPYRLLISDATGKPVDGKGLSERMVFLYDTRRVKLSQVVSDVSLDLGSIVGNVNGALRQVREAMVQESPGDLGTRLAGWFEQLMPFSQDKLESFLQFIRAPYLATFEVQGIQNQSYKLACVNAHLWYGKPKQREREFFALLDWMARRASLPDNQLDAQVMVLMGDLNLDFSSNNDKRRAAIEKVIVDLNANRPDNEARVNFPFLDKHPAHAAAFTTNARKSETFDQIAWFGRDDRFPRGRHNEQAGTISADDFDYGMLDFVRLFGDTGLSEVERFEFDLSDHMPIWVRLPLPSQTQHRFVVNE